MTGDGNWTYLIGDANPLLIDAGVGNAAHVEAIATGAPRGLAQIVVTHAHSDHVSGAPALHARWPSATLAKHPWPARDPKLPWTVLNDGDVVTTDEGDLHVLLTPGHAPDHLTLWHADSRTVFVGDMMQQDNTVVILASHGGSLRDYLRSLQRIKDLQPVRALPAHGPAIDDPVALIERYIAHRAHREAQVIDALESGRADVASIAAAIYPTLQPALLPMAQESVLAHLHKLADDGVVATDGTRWTKVR